MVCEREERRNRNEKTDLFYTDEMGERSNLKLMLCQAEAVGSEMQSGEWVMEDFVGSLKSHHWTCMKC